MRHNQQQHLPVLHHSLKISPSPWGTSEHFVLQIKKPRYRAIKCLSWHLMHWVSDPNQEFSYPKIVSGQWRKMDISGLWGFFPTAGPFTGHGYPAAVCPSRELLRGPGVPAVLTAHGLPVSSKCYPGHGVGVAHSSSQLDFSCASIISYTYSLRWTDHTSL